MIRTAPIEKPARPPLAAPSCTPRRWPMPRHEMMEGGQILERLTFDVVEMMGDRGEGAAIAEGDLERLGWSKGQLALYGNQAVSTAEHRVFAAAD